jgi:hypothetical protein
MTEQTTTPAAQTEPMVPKPKVPAMVLEHLKTIQRRIDPEHAGFRASDAVRKALESELRNYMGSWVYPLLQNIIEWAEGAEAAAKAGADMTHAYKRGYLR